MTLADELRGIFLTAALTDAQRDEMIAVSQERPFSPGEVLFAEGAPADLLWVLLEGEVELTRQSATESIVMATMSNPGQWAGGLRAWDPDGGSAGYRGTGRAKTSGRFLTVPSEDLGRMVGEWFPFGKHMIIGIYQTVRRIEAMARQRESLVALGTLAAGLAHEINNPAAASLRAVEALRETWDTMLTALTHLAAAGLDVEQYVALGDLRRQAAEAPPRDESALAAADREETIGSWLAERGIDHAWQLASVLASAGVDREWCRSVEAAVGTESLGWSLQWAASALDTDSLLGQIHDTTTRISGLVDSVRSYSQVDRASLQRVDVHGLLDSTLTMLAHKLRDVDVQRDFGDLSEIDAYAGELNQVWTNVIDNAVDAMAGRGTLRIATRRDGTDVLVDITDSGPGMLPDVVDRAFEPFFTTKDVGQGTGLGLDISRRIVVDRHGGEITFDTGPTGTTVHVRIPMSIGSPAA
jgi:signal transduction histidine kinase